MVYQDPEQRPRQIRPDRELAEPPLTRSEAAARFVASASEQVPRELEHIALPEIAPYDLVAVTREGIRELGSRVSEPKRPLWVPSALAPKKAPLILKPRPIDHRGRMLEPCFVFAPDDRRTYDDRSYPWGTVCKIVTAPGLGSGAIVGPRHVLTASHCVDWAANGAGTVEVHRAGGSVAATTAITKVWYFTKVTGTVGWSENDEDYAVLVTADRIGDRFGWLGTRTYDSGWDEDRYWWSIGYPGDVASGNFPVWQRDKWLDEDAWDFGGGRSMETDADQMPGQSGSPMFAWWSDGPYVVAVMSNHGGGENWCSGGSDMTHLVVHARAQDP